MKHCVSVKHHCPPVCDSTADEDDPSSRSILFWQGEDRKPNRKAHAVRKSFSLLRHWWRDQLHVAVIDGDGTPRTWTWSSQKRETSVGLIRNVSMEARHHTRKHAPACSLIFAELRTKEAEGEDNNGPEGSRRFGHVVQKRMKRSGRP